MTNWFENIPLAKALDRQCMAVSKYPRYLFDIKYDMKFHRDPFSRLKQATQRYDIGSGFITYGYNYEQLRNDYFNHEMIDDFNWIVNYIPNKKIPNGSFAMIPTIWKQYDGVLMWGKDARHIYVPKIHDQLPIVIMRNVDLARNMIGKMEFFHYNKTNDTGPICGSLIRLRLDDMTHELTNIGFDERWGFTIDDYDPTFHDIFDTEFFRDEIGLIGAMRHG